MSPRRIESRYAEMMARLSKSNLTFALLIWGLSIAVAWGEWRVMALGVLMVAIAAPVNVFINVIGVRRFGAFAGEILRTAVNLPLTVVYCHLVGWALPVWLWLPFMALAIDPVDQRNASVSVVVFCLGMDGAALLDGVSPAYAIVFTALAVHCALMSRGRVAVVHDLLRISDEQRLDLERALETRKAAEERAAAVRAELVEVSRQAGMAEVASTVLHNVGNVLNSANVSSDLIVENIRTSKVGSLARVAELLRDHAGDLPRYFAEDERARHLPAFLTQLSEVLERERADIGAEMTSLQKHVEHVKTIVAVQQSHAHAVGMTEELDIADLVEDALSLKRVELENQGVTVVRDFEELPALPVDRHKVLLILINLLNNARDAVRAGAADKNITLRLRRTSEGGARVEVCDSGSGISAENLTLIFNHGFTTKKDGHGFGLHGSACAAMAMGGQLVAHSDGEGRGATFSLRLIGTVARVTRQVPALIAFSPSPG
jgi:signal transduction histidine kinase